MNIENIIEKLGIIPLAAKIVIATTPKYTGFNLSEVRELEQQRNELLEALIEEYFFIHDFIIVFGDELNHDLRDMFLRKQHDIENIIIKTDPKHRSWEEIKALL